jgi:hypothetical protein
LRDAEAVKFMTKQTYINASNQQWGGTSAVHDGVSHAFDILVLSFSRILMLLMWLALPITNDKVTEDVLDTTTDLHLSTVTDKAGGGPTTADDILQCIDKRFF